MKALIITPPAALLHAPVQVSASRSRVPAASAFSLAGSRIHVVSARKEWHREDFRDGKGRLSCRHWRVQPARDQAHQGSGWRAFALQAQTAQKNVKWILESVGDGDCRHLNSAVPLPGSFELASDSAIVGRAGGKADILLGVATVSSMHARLEKRDGTLYITDLDSTNGTYIDAKRIRPGAVTPVRPGSTIVFGDQHLAVFRVEQGEEIEEQPQGAESPVKPSTE